jgi:DNA-binding MarR family transcriptional regulator
MLMTLAKDSKLPFDCYANSPTQPERTIGRCWLRMKTQSSTAQFGQPCKMKFKPFQHDTRFRMLMNFTILKRHKISTIRQAHILIATAIQPGISTAELSEICNVDSNTIRSSIRKCAALGLLTIKRVESTVNCGFLTYHPTADGLELAHKLK